MNGCIFSAADRAETIILTQSSPIAPAPERDATTECQRKIECSAWSVTTMKPTWVSGLPGLLTLIGKSTYHILLIQILGYGMITAYWGTHYAIDSGFGPDVILDMITAWAIFISFGIKAPNF